MEGSVKGKNRIMLAAVSSGSGKTTITCGLIAALKKRGLETVSFKCGPDYIDPMFHRRVLGIQSGNLDTYFTDKSTVRALLARGMRSADIAVIEGVMGYYDGLGGLSTDASAYDLARATDTPVILIADGRGISVTLAAVIKGIKNYKRDSNIAGIILNRVSESYYPRLSGVIGRECGIPVLGYLPIMKDLRIPSRHLGLISPNELDEFDEWIDKICAGAERYIDIDAVIRLASCAGVLSGDGETAFTASEGVKIAVARDEAFSFYYSENIDILERLGAKIVYFSPLRDSRLPDGISGVILWGGYPELYAKELSENTGMRESVRIACESGMPCIAECGGFLYLGRALCGADGKTYDMAGVLNGTGYKTDRLVRFGYIEAAPKACALDSGRKPLLGRGSLKGHEFHYWESTDCGTSCAAWKPLSPDKKYDCMVHTETMAAGFPHFYYYSNPDAVRSFLNRCREYRFGSKLPNLQVLTQ